MLTVVLAVAVVGIVLLGAAVLTDSTIVAIIVIVIALVGLGLLARDWLANRGAGESRTQPELDDAESGHASERSLEPDEFEPDVPYEESETHATKRDDT
ncbi:MAG TPA: hypothetical protein VH496_15895 [Mycobacterium sp.]